MRPLVTFTVANVLPEKLSRLHELSRNLYWTWNPIIREFLRSIDPGAWHRTNHHPLKMLETVSVDRLNELAEDPQFVERYHQALKELDSYLHNSGWYSKSRPEKTETIAYLSAEFGLHESIPLYSGGLGVLSGDHTKSASDLSLPFVCVGLMYQMGYFEQRLQLDGTQLESYNINDPTHLPVSLMTDEKHRPIRISVDFPRGTVQAQIWRLDVGKVPIYLLDTNIKENVIPEYRDIADYLYGGDLETRIMQEIMLGIGGMRALRALGIDPTVTHSNEGHSAFLMLERTRMLMGELGMNFAEASELVSAGSVFTTHTPVPAGNDVFPIEMVDRYFGNYWPQLGLTRDQFIGLGRIDASDMNEAFSMTVLALRLSSKHNGVSQLHGEVSRRMWKNIWKNIPAHESPIDGITNGVHTLTWLSDHIGDLFTKHLGSTWRERPGVEEIWEHIDRIPDEELWNVKDMMRADMTSYVRWRLEEQQSELYTASQTGRDAEHILDPNALTIGFARRFATYKRATLLFRDHERALRLFNNPRYPIQMVIAGKAHPKDAAGKEFIKDIFGLLRETGLEGRIVFVEDYDMAVARRIVQGCDIWLNTPRRPLEASGTSGMKAAVNATLNVSILDGWWPEGYDGTNGFAIGDERGLAHVDLQDEIESRQLYRILEEEVIPMFYDRGEHGIPHRWIAMQKRALKTLTAHFSSDRMVKEYAERYYFSCSDRFQKLRANGGRGARDLMQWKRRTTEKWNTVRFTEASAGIQSDMKVGDIIHVTTTLILGDLPADGVHVEAFYGGIGPDGLIAEGAGTPLPLDSVENGTARFSGDVPLRQAGHAGLTVRAFPWHQDLGNKFEMNLITFASPDILSA